LGTNDRNTYGVHNAFVKVIDFIIKVYYNANQEILNFYKTLVVKEKKALHSVMSFFEKRLAFYLEPFCEGI